MVGCSSSEPETALRLTVEFASSLKIDQLKVSVGEQGSGAKPEEKLVPEEPALLESGVRVVALLPEEWDGRSVEVTMAGLASGKEVGRGKVSAEVRVAETVERTVRLEAPCVSECTPGATECVGDQVRLCIADSEGCARFSPPQACPSERPYCSNGVCEAKCSDECATKDARRCKESGYQVCGEHDSDECLDWGPVISCGAGEKCEEASGQCVLDCGGQPCTCQPSETKPCTDVGECRGGVRQCVNGEFGECEWQAGPTAEICDGKDNDCNGTPDDELIAPPCEKQDGVCQGAVKKCGGGKGWLVCGDSDYQAYAQSKSLTYEATETLCDGKDNDCNGKTDEPAKCCQPNCSGKACGADDGCGHPCGAGSCSGAQEVCQSGKCVCQPDCAGKACGASDGCGGKCQTGTCGANSTCQSGSCVCSFVSCGSACCASAAVCASGSCCTPSCGTRKCGPDPVCGTSCGNCSGSDVCDAQGQCVAGTTPGFVAIPAGTFTMGSPTSEPCRDDDEDQHQVTLTHGFELQATEVTQGEFQALMGYNPSNFSSCGTSCPVEKVSWGEAAAYCNKLSAQKGLAQCYGCTGSGASVSCSEATSYSGQMVYDCPGYRLPTEAEWEYAYRAGTTMAYYGGANDPSGCSSTDAKADAIGWYDGNSGDTTHPVGQKQKNSWGLYDMAGNVYEWCHDWYQKSLGSSAVTDSFGAASGSYRLLRGGSWYSNPNYLRAASRGYYAPTNRNSSLGLRCCRSAP